MTRTFDRTKPPFACVYRRARRGPGAAWRLGVLFRAGQLYDHVLDLHTLRPLTIRRVDAKHLIRPCPRIQRMEAAQYIVRVQEFFRAAGVDHRRRHADIVKSLLSTAAGNGDLAAMEPTRRRAKRPAHVPADNIGRPDPQAFGAAR